MGETLGELWRDWAHGGARSLLGVAFVLLVAVWVAAAVLIFREARSTWRSPVPAITAVVAIPLLVAAVGIAQPSVFQWWALLGLVLAPVLALLSGVAFRRSTARCPQSHMTVPAWAFCPWCPSPLGPGVSGDASAVLARHVGRGVGTLLRRPGAPPQPPLPPPAAVDTGPVLMWLVPDAPGRPDVLVREPGAVIGRNPAAQVHIDDPTVSWEHAKIVEREGAPALVDLASSNGTYVNGERVENSFLLTDDRVQFGGVVFRVRR